MLIALIFGLILLSIIVFIVAAHTDRRIDEIEDALESKDDFSHFQDDIYED